MTSGPVCSSCAVQAVECQVHYEFDGSRESNVGR